MRVGADAADGHQASSRRLPAVPRSCPRPLRRDDQDARRDDHRVPALSRPRRPPAAAPRASRRRCRGVRGKCRQARGSTQDGAGHGDPADVSAVPRRHWRGTCRARRPRRVAPHLPRRASSSCTCVGDGPHVPELDRPHDVEGATRLRDVHARPPPTACARARSVLSISTTSPGGLVRFACHGPRSARPCSCR